MKQDFQVGNYYETGRNTKAVAALRLKGVQLNMFCLPFKNLQKCKNLKES